MTFAPAILGLGHFAPPQVLSNADLAKLVDTSDEWITTRTGIRERRIAAPGVACSDLALEAGQRALASAGMQPDQLSHVIVATFTPDAYIPSAACVLQHKIGAGNAVAFDIGAACSGFLYALEAARALLAIHPEALILVAASEVVTSRINFQDRTTCVLFGDGAGAVVLGRAIAERPGLAKVRDIQLRSDGSMNGLLTVRGGGSGTPLKYGERTGDSFFVQMQGREVFKFAVRNMHASAVDLLQRLDLSTADVDLFIPHQANMRIIEALAKKLDFPMDKIFVNLQGYGNTSAASIPLALSEAHDQGRMPRGTRVLLATFGGGFTWGSAVLEC